MNRSELLTELMADLPEPGELIYIERRGESYAWRRTNADSTVSSPDDEASLPDAWIYYSGPWPTQDSEAVSAFFDDLFAEMDGGQDRCRWSVDDPWPHWH
ncbi:MAG: hypothetical protein M3308_04875 [Actinomycetota bacterium]|nr:hypothetical protein [Actinomycetota bacterium]